MAIWIFKVEGNANEHRIEAEKVVTGSTLVEFRDGENNVIGAVPIAELSYLAKADAFTGGKNEAMIG